MAGQAVAAPCAIGDRAAYDVGERAVMLNEIQIGAYQNSTKSYWLLFTAYF